MPIVKDPQDLFLWVFSVLSVFTFLFLLPEQLLLTLNAHGEADKWDRADRCRYTREISIVIVHAVTSRLFINSLMYAPDRSAAKVKRVPC